MSGAKVKDTKDDEKGKPRRNKSDVEREILADKQEGESSQLRYYIIPCDLKQALTGFQHKRKFRELMDTCATTQGVYRKLTGCFANFVILHHVENGKDCPQINKTFYDQCWSAIDNKVQFLKAKLGARKPSKSKRNKKPKEPKEKSNGFTPLLNHMIESTGLELSCLPQPVQFEMRSPTTRDMAVSALNHVEINLEKRIASYVLWRLGNLPSAKYARNKSIRKLTKQVVTRVMKGQDELEENFEIEDKALEISEVNSVLQEVSGVVKPLIPASLRKSVSKSFRDNAHQLLPFLHHISTCLQRVRLRRNAIYEEKVDQLNLQSSSMRRKILQRVFQEEGLRFPGKPFSILPDWQLQPVFVDYASTQLQTLFGSEIGSVQFFQEHVFDLHRIRHLIKPDWHFMGFRTNGVELHVRLGCLKVRRPPSTNSLSLVDAGYKLPKPKQPVDATAGGRGVYRILQDRYDIAMVSEDTEDNIKAILIDPGVIKPVSVREVKLSSCTSAASILNKSKTWHVDEDTYKQDTMWGASRKMESQRRASKYRKYPEILKLLGKTTKRTCELNTYMAYLRCLFSNLRPLFRELSSKQRRIVRYNIKKSIQKCMDKLADRIMKKPKDAPSDEVRVVFYGDGRFRPQKGHVSVPTKKVIKYCSYRGIIVVLSERGTSKYCPSCTDGQMKDIGGRRRIRRCTSDPNAVSPCVFTYTDIDRDDCATISMALCASQAIKSHTRPVQFCV